MGSEMCIRDRVNSDPDTKYAIFLFCKKVIDIFVNKFFVNGVEKFKIFDLESLESTNILVIKIAVNKDVAIPINNVVAKPFIGPEPNTNKIKAVNPVVMLASKIDDKALLNPSLTDCFSPLPLFNSSRILSKISTLASTDIPIVRTIPAIPGRVNTAPRPAKIPKIKTRFKTNATSA